MIERGEAYMATEKTAATTPQKTFLPVPCRAKTETRATAEKTASTKPKSARTLIFSFFGAW